MTPPSRENSVDPHSSLSEEKWSRKKDALLERLSKDTGSVKLDKKDLVAERKRRAEEVEKLEDDAIGEYYEPTNEPSSDEFYEAAQEWRNLPEDERDKYKVG